MLLKEQDLTQTTVIRSYKNSDTIQENVGINSNGNFLVDHFICFFFF